MKVNEIFYSLQGEGFHTGTPAVFVRFSGCNLRCPWCDTDFSAHTEMTEQQIVEKVLELSGPGSFVVLTGGEPSLQATDSLVRLLQDNGCYVTMETNGTHAVPESLDWVTCSPKPNSKVVLGMASEVKVVYEGQDVERWREVVKANHYFLQPCSCANTADVVAYILEHPWWRLSLQTHKLIDIR